MNGERNRSPPHHNSSIAVVTHPQSEMETEICLSWGRKLDQNYLAAALVSKVWLQSHLWGNSSTSVLLLDMQSLNVQSWHFGDDQDRSRELQLFEFFWFITPAEQPRSGALLKGIKRSTKSTGLSLFLPRQFNQPSAIGEKPKQPSF